MSKSAVGQFSTSNVLLEDSQVQLSFPAATDKNGETIAYYAKIYWQPIYCSVSGANYISIETTDTVRVNTEIPLTVTGSTILQSTITLNFDNKLSTDVRIYVVVTARDGINDHPDDPPVLTSGYYYVIRHQIPTLALSSAEWVPGAIREVQLNGSIVDYGFTTPGNLVDLLATDLIWQAWRTGLETALGSINLTFNFKIAYSSDNINFSTPATYDITVIKELINATPGNAAYTNDLDFSFSFNKDATIPIPIESITQENSYFFKAYISSSHFTLSLDSNSTSILLTSNTPLFVMRNGIIQINLPKATTAKTSAIMAARGPQQDVIDGQSLALYDLHTESGQSEVANSPSIGFFDNLHNLMAKVGINYNISTNTGDIEITNLLTNGNIILTPNGTGVVKIGITPLILIPSLTGNSGKFLTTNGTTVSWASVLPSQTGNSGKFLITNGIVASWATIDLSGYVPLSGGTMTGNLTAPNLILDGAGTPVGTAETSKSLYFRTDNKIRWAIRSNTSDESGDNAGSDFCVACYDDNGIAIDYEAFKIIRATGKGIFSQTPMVGSNDIWHAGNLNPSNYALTSHTHNYLPTNGGTLSGSLTVQGDIYTPNSNSQGVRIGDNAYIADVNVAHTLGIISQTSTDTGYINFSTGQNNALGCVDGGNLTFRGKTVLHTGFIRTGQCTLHSSNATSITFSSALPSTPYIVLTPVTTTVGVIAPKINSKSTTGFTATIGGSGFSNIVCDYIAIVV